MDESHDDAGLATCALSHDCETPNILTVKAVLVKALAWYFTHKAITRISPNATLNVYCLPFIASMASHLFDQLTEHAFDSQGFEDLLTSWNIKEVSSDVCIFSAVAHNLKYQVQEGNAMLATFASSMPETHSSPAQLVTALKKLVSGEWLGENCMEYQDFLPDVQLREQATALYTARRGSVVRYW